MGTSRWLAALVAAAVVGGNVTVAHAERLLVQPRAGLKLRDLDGMLQPHGGRRAHAIPQIGVHIVELPEQANARAVAQALARNPHIKSAEVDRRVPPAFTPNDANYANAWHLPKIDAPRAWDFIFGAGVTIAILDSGVDPSHPDLVQNLVAGYNIFDDNTNTTDFRGHGTLAAGTAAMAGNNAIGSAGVAFASRIMPIRVSDADGFAFFSTLAEGLTWAADHGARVASMSFRDVCGSSAILAAAQYLRGKGGVVIGAAGNTGAEAPIAPSDSITCVSATDANDVKAGFSSSGSYVDVAAPGVGIYSSNLGGGYAAVSGTSFSAPMTAGVYALMIAANPQLAPSQLDAALFSTVVDLGAAGKDKLYGHGRINAGAAVAAVSTGAPRDTTAPSVSITAPVAGSQVKGLVPVDVSASDNVGVTRVELYAGGSLVGTDGTTPYRFSWDTAGRANGSATLQAKAFDAAGNVASSQVTVSVANTPSDTAAPSVSITSPASGSQVKGVVTVSVNAADNVGVTRVELYAAGGLVGSDGTAPYGFTWNTSARADGWTNLEARAFDAAGNVGSGGIVVSVANTPASLPLAAIIARAIAAVWSGYAGFAARPANETGATQLAGWYDGTGDSFAGGMQVVLGEPKPVARVVVYTQLDYAGSPVDFSVQGWNGSDWVTLASVAGNTLVQRTLTFPAFTTDRIRVHDTSALGSWSRITAIEAWGS